MSYQLGVDLGTTYTAAAVLREGRTEVATLGTRTLAIPSVAFLLESGDMLIGEPAERRSLTDPDRFAREFKRRMGDPTPIMLGGTPFSAHTLMARLLRAVVGIVADREGGPPGHTVVTCPASWRDYKRDLLAQAIHQADIGPASIATEPEAAAVHYASAARVAPGEIVAVYDLGGGTFDATVLRNTGAAFELLGEPRGIEHLGGVHFDEAVFAHVVRQIEHAFDPDATDAATLAAVARLRRDCVEAKEALSSDTEVAIPVVLPNLRSEVRLTRAEFESMIRPALAETVETMHRALQSAGVAPDDVTVVLLVGGSSRIPLISQVVGSEMRRPTAVDIHPKHAVALGAALLAGQRLAPAARAPAPRTVPISPPAPAGAPAGGAPPSGAPVPPADAPAVPAPPGASPPPPGPVGPAPRRAAGPAWRWVAAAAAAAALAGLAWFLASGDDGAPPASAGDAPGEDPSGDSGPGDQAGPAIEVPQGPPLAVDTIAYTSREQTFWNIWLIGADGSNRRQLTREVAVYPRLPAISPDRRSVAYTVHDGAQAWDLHVADSNGDSNREVATGLAPDARATWSPDGTKLAFVTDDPGRDVVILDLTTGEQRNLTQDDEEQGDPAWSPDGQSIAYWSRSGGNQDIWVVPVAGGEPRRLTEDPGDDADPAWHPTGTSLAFASNRDGDWEIFLMGPDGEGERPITDHDADDQDPAWSPDGGFIAFETNRDAPPEREDDANVYVMLSDGSDPRQLTSTPGFDAHPSWGLAP